VEHRGDLDVAVQFRNAPAGKLARVTARLQVEAGAPAAILSLHFVQLPSKPRPGNDFDLGVDDCLRQVCRRLIAAVNSQHRFPLSA
jgi:hypothetical protein